MRKKLMVLAALVATSSLGAITSQVVAQEEEERDVKAEFEAKKEAVDENDAQALFELALWAEANGLRTDYKRTLRKVIKADRNHEEARKLLGYVKYEGEWVTEREKERLEKKKEEAEKIAQGLRKWRGEWYPAEDVAMFEKGLFKVEVDGETKWVTEKEKEKIEAGMVLYQGKWISPEDKARIDQGLFPIDGEWVTLEEANEYHSNLETRWELERDYTAAESTLDHDFAQQMMVHTDRAIEQAYNLCNRRIPENFPKVTLFLVSTVDDYNSLAGATNSDSDSLMSSLAYGCFSFEDPDAARHIGVTKYTVLDETNPSANDLITGMLARQAAAEAALRSMECSEELPRWFITGLSTYCGRYWDPFNAQGIKGYGRWSVESLNRDGGLKSLSSFFDPFEITRQSVLQSGLLISYLLHAEGKSDKVVEQWNKVRELLGSEDQAGLSKEFLKLETILAKDGEKEVQAYAESLLTA